MKKISFLLAILMIFTFSFFALASGEEEKTADQGSSKAEANKEEAVGDSDIGDYTIVIDSCRLAKDYEGKDVVIVKYIFGNVASDESASFIGVMEATVYQDGVGLNESYFLDDSAGYDSANQSKEIKKGHEVEVEVAYELNDTTTDIEVEVAEWLSLEDTVVTKTFTIA